MSARHGATWNAYGSATLRSRETAVQTARISWRAYLIACFTWPEAVVQANGDGAKELRQRYDEQKRHQGAMLEALKGFTTVKRVRIA